MFMKVLTSICVLMLLSITAHSQDRAQFYVGYQFNRSNFEFKAQNFTIDELTDTHGFNTSLTLFPGKKPGPIGFTGELAGNFTGGSQGESLVTLMAGLTVQRRTGTAQPFIRGLVGGARNRTANQQIQNIFDTSDIGLAWAAGGGLDIKTKSRLAIRLIQVDYMRTNHFGTSVNHLRLGAGLRF